MDGFLIVFKPPGWTSHDIVQYVRKKYRIKKVGHLGTLDPGACGVLPLALGKATKLSQYILSQDKTYRFELTLGISTDTLDAQGEIIAESEFTDEHIDQLIQNYQKYVGTIQQVPPMHSAIKQGGKKLYELARKGEQVERPTREVTLYSLNLIDKYNYEQRPRLLFEVECSKGTYIRTLAKDLAELTDCREGYMSFLIRKQTSSFDLNQSTAVNRLPESKSELANKVYSLDFPLNELSAVKLDNKQQINRISNGNFIQTSYTGTEGKLYRVYDCTYENDGIFIGIGKMVSDNTMKPEKILL